MHVAHSKENHSRVCFLAFEDVSQYALGSSAPEKVFFSPNIYIYLVELENMAPCQHLCRDVNNDMVGAIKVC